MASKMKPITTKKKTVDPKKRGKVLQSVKRRDNRQVVEHKRTPGTVNQLEKKLESAKDRLSSTVSTVAKGKARAAVALARVEVAKAKKNALQSKTKATSKNAKKKVTKNKSK